MTTYLQYAIRKAADSLDKIGQPTDMTAFFGPDDVYTADGVALYLERIAASVRKIGDPGDRPYEGE